MVWVDKKKSSHRWQNKEGSWLSWSSGLGWKCLDEQQQVYLQELEKAPEKSFPWKGNQQACCTVWSPMAEQYITIPGLECHYLGEKGIMYSGAGGGGMGGQGGGGGGGARQRRAGRKGPRAEGASEEEEESEPGSARLPKAAVPKAEACR